MVPLLPMLSQSLPLTTPPMPTTTMMRRMDGTCPISTMRYHDLLLVAGFNNLSSPQISSHVHVSGVHEAGAGRSGEGSQPWPKPGQLVREQGGALRPAQEARLPAWTRQEG